MRIAMVGHKRVPSREGGIEVVVEELAARMVMHGHGVTCYNRGRETEPSWRIFFLPSFCFSSSFFLREISPP